MKTKFELLYLVCVILSELTNVTSLQCYRCDNCTTVKEEYLVTCGSNATSTTTTTTTTTSTTTTTTTTVSPDATTTVAPNATTTIAPNATTTVAPNTTTTIAPNATTTIAPNATTTIAPNATTTIAANTTNTTSVAQVSRVKRAAEENRNCNCQNENCDCSGQYFMQSRAAPNTTVTYVCVKDTRTVNGQTQIKRDCAVKYNQTTATCTTASFLANCTICEKDKCNGSITYKFSSVVLLLSILSYVL